MNDSPIFNQLKAERGYDPACEIPDPIWDLVQTDKAVNAAPAKTNLFLLHDIIAGLNRDSELDETVFRSDGAWIAQPLSKGDSEKVKYFEELNPDQAEEKYGSFSGFVDHVVQEFYAQHPRAVDVTTSVEERWENEMSMRVGVEGRVPTRDSDAFTKARIKFFEKAPVGLTNANALRRKLGLLPPKEAVVPSLRDFLDTAIEDFRKANPNAVITNVKASDDPENPFGLVIEGMYPKDPDTPSEIATSQLRLFLAAKRGEFGGDEDFERIRAYENNKTRMIVKPDGSLYGDSEERPRCHTREDYNEE